MKKALRILAGIGAIVLIILLVIITMGFTGNPISKILATRGANKYVEENYSDLDLLREEAVFEFKRGFYIVKYYKTKSKDIHFGIETDHLGRVTNDGYKEEVLSKWNTRIRLEDEFIDYVEKIVRDNLDYDFNMVHPSTFGDEEGERVSNLEIDMIFDLHNIPFEQHLSIYIYEEDRSFQKMSEVLVEVDKLMEENSINISKYTIVLEEPMDDESGMGAMLEILGFPKEYIDSEDLPKALEDYIN